MELYGWRAWLVVGIAIVGWVLFLSAEFTFIEMRGYAYAMYVANYRLSLALENCSYYAYEVHNATLGVLNYTDYALTVNTQVLSEDTEALNQTMQLLPACNESGYLVQEDIEALNATAHALNTTDYLIQQYNELMRELVNATR